MSKIKNVLIWLFKAFLGGTIALIAASFVCLFYYNVGTHIENPTGATDYIWENAGNFVSKMTEGIALKKIDSNGYLSNSISADNVDVLLMGSSHMEGTNLPDEQTTSVLLNNNIDLSVYNIGISGHNLLVNSKNLDSALKTFEPSSYVIIETSSTIFSDEAIAEVLNNTKGKIPSYDSGILYYLQKIPYLKLIYAQYENMNDKNNEDIDTSNENDEKKYSYKMYNALTQYINEVCTANGVKAIIFYHPSLALEPDGTVSTDVDENALYLFRTACEYNDIIFVDMTDDFLNMYYESYVLPNGFCNSSVGTGHLNRYGHKAIAERLTSVINDLEEANVQ